MTRQVRRGLRPAAHVRGMLAFEAALARASARAGVIPGSAAEEIAGCCRVELFDVDRLYREAVPTGTLAIPLVRMLTCLVPGDGRKFVHWGATSQDAIDTALVLQLRDGLADRHRGTVMAGRTLLQQALPITFGRKAARWLGLVTRQLERLRTLRQEMGGGLLMAEALNMTLAQRLGKDEAHQLVQSVSRRVASDGADLRRAALEGWRVRAVLGPDAIDAALDPAAYLGSTSPLIDRALRRFEAMRSVGAAR